MAFIRPSISSWRKKQSLKIRPKQLFEASANIDDQNPETLPFVLELLLASNALDAWIQPIIMKKGRPAFILSFLCQYKNLKHLLNIVLAETKSLGVRYHQVDRMILKREIVMVETPWGLVQAKAVFTDDLCKLRPEFEECRKIALENNVPLWQVMAWFEQRTL